MTIFLRILQNLPAVLQHTPAWVFAVFAALVLLGLQALRRRTMAIPRLLIVPAVFIIWGVVNVMTRAASHPVLIADWLITGAIGFAIAWLTLRVEGVAFDRAKGQVTMPGSAVPLIRNVVIFVAKYFLGVAMAVAPAMQGSIAPWDVGVSGASAGYFIGWLARLALKYRSETRSQPVAPVG